MRVTRIVFVGGAVLLAAAAAASASIRSHMLLGPVAQTSHPTYEGFYDGHKDAYVITDVSSKPQARALHANFASSLRALHGLPDQYFVEGRAASGQLTVFDSEPGEKSYNPLWEEQLVTWKPGATPVLLVRDDQITRLAKQGMLTVRDAHVVLNAPITKVG